MNRRTAQRQDRKNRRRMLRKKMAIAMIACGLVYIPCNAMSKNEIYTDYVGSSDGYDLEDTIVNGSAYGNIDTEGSGVSGTTFNVTNSEIKSYDGQGGVAYGGLSYNGNVAKNTINFKNSSVEYGVYGGYSQNGDATNNHATVSGSGKVDFNVYGGRSLYGNATDNTAEVSGGTVEGNVCGGFGDDSTGNHATVSGGTVEGNVYGGYSQDGDVTDNTATVSGGTVGEVVGGQSDGGGASGNKANVSGDGTVQGSVFGGVAGGGDATDNEANVSGGTVQGSVYGGVSYVGDATGNTATVSGGTVQGYVLGGYSYYNNATGNTVVISGGTFGSDRAGASRIVGGMLEEGEEDATTVAAAAERLATGNTVILASKVTGATILHGGALFNVDYLTADVPEGFNCDLVTGNTLEVYTKGQTIGGLHNFENFYFILPKGIKNNDTVLTVESGEETTFKKKASIGVAMAAGAVLNKGDKVTLIKNEEGFIGVSGESGITKDTDYQKVDIDAEKLKGPQHVTALQGISLEYDFELSNTDTTIDATVIKEEEKQQEEQKQEEQQQEEQKQEEQKQEEQKQEETTPAPVVAPEEKKSDSGTGARVRPQTKAVVESRLATLATLNSGADLVAGHAMRNAMVGASAGRGLAAGDAREGVAISPFAAVSGGTQRLESGSHVDVSGVSAVVGLAARKDLEVLDLTAGVFFEFGSSRFNTHNSFDGGDVDGKGHATYTGAGILARLDVTDSLLRGLYLEGSFRFGGISDDWHTDDMRDAVTGRRASFDLYSPYHGAHAGLGYVWEITEAFKLDFYGKWLWTHLYGDDTHVALDPYEFKDVDSHRLRAGVRADWFVSDQFSVYAGAAYEREFDSKARATAYGLDTPSPTVKGDTGVFDVGFSFKPGAVPDLTVELGATATAGKRHGISGNMLVKYEF